VDPNEIQPHLEATGITEARISICARPVFVIGAPRSGTTVLAQSLAQHSEFWTSDESQVLWDLFEGGRLDKNYLRQGRYDGSWLFKQEVAKEEFLAFLGLGLNALFTSRSQGKRWVDQTPVYALLAENLARMFPGAFFVHILRDGRKVVHSMIHFLARFNDRGVPDAVKRSPRPPWSADFTEACRTWRCFVEAALNFQAQFPDRCLTVINEQMVADPAGQFEEILQFIQAAQEDRPANFFRSNRLNSSFAHAPDSSERLRSSVGPWGLWNPQQRRIFVEEAGATMLKYGLAAESELTSLQEAVSRT
jgi:protein-tyrosine sulfotransferase